MGLIKFAIKSGVCIYAVKYTVDEGAWSSSENAIKFKEKCCNAINENEFYKTGKSHFLANVSVPEVSKHLSSSFQIILNCLNLIIVTSTSRKI